MAFKTISRLTAILCIICCVSCSRKKADLIVYNAKIYTIDSTFSRVSAMAIKDGKIVETGSDDAIFGQFDAPDLLDAGGKFLYPGFIDAHCHFFNYGLGLQTADLTGTTSWEAILDTMKAFAVRHPDGWLIGRGWDQNDWAVQAFPNNDVLNTLFPDRPVLLTRIDGHAAIANAKALSLAGVQPGMTLTGGEVHTDRNRLTGLLVDNAVDLVYAKIPAPGPADVEHALLDAQQNCFAVGLTTVDDCGLDARVVSFIDSMQTTGKLSMRVYAMLSDAPANYEFARKKGKIKTDRLSVRAFKVYADGALGSRGACLLAPYADQTGHYGFLLSDPKHFDSVANELAALDFQMCTHAIGDSGNRTILNTYLRRLEGKNDKRWRIEHAQVIAPEDFAKFGAASIVPSVQPTHATSDMYWAGKRLGPERVKGAYAYKQLLQQNGWIPLGTDFPVEDISPFKTFYAAVVRKDAAGKPDSGFQMENALSREAALRGMTIWAAKANFEEGEKGSLEKGKWADFVLLDQDLLTVAPEKILQTRVEATYVGGKKVHGAK
ncbi:amidohydrolase [Flavihumibacter petaseus]|uniref:Putative hydrolase n=1 Tax=Flavihumibacter petaseus NBRC 106054 TaxID=1220578 RepID=A0A0E9N0I3_9BACT|nr:amidohydrolase [Flavihumibacter petaseus]GAO43293.1 putative hydrolase [Flavihumibacter petaseus NBRC 106054]